MTAPRLLGLVLLAGLCGCAAPSTELRVRSGPAEAAVRDGDKKAAHIPPVLLPQRGKTAARAAGLGDAADFAP